MGYIREEGRAETTLNLREGTRRLALLLGAAGAIVGGFASYLELQPVLSQRARHNRFEQLASLDDVEKERKCRLLGYDGGCFRMKLSPGAASVEQPNDWQDVPSRPPKRASKGELMSDTVPMFAPDGTVRSVPSAQRDAALKSGGREAVKILDPSGTARWAPKDELSKLLAAGAKAAPMVKVYLDDNGNPTQIAPYAATAEPSSSDVPTKFSSEAVTPLASEVNMREIKTINWSQGKDYGVASIETQDGQTIYPTPAPSRWLYLLIALLPVLGFFIPWGTVRAIGWVAAGFAASPR